ncbi:cytochrome P460 family protein [Shewanella kaireitica]|uniref:cytochrome P460 family protein n=1 Tax=Shewanella kaireitica TaxID=212021 RepID=UPI00200C8CE1|nr:cytochrome P460 family protein [Shewanella kaireitica]MCL1092154.1 cytochrome P460 family protein [Shewanella kaireitica]
MKYLLCTVLIFFSLSIQAGDLSKTYSKHVDQQGNITFPSDFLMDGFVHLGSNTVATPESGEIFNINSSYTQKSALMWYQKTGEWPDGTLIVKILKFVSAKKSLLSGQVQHQTSQDIAFVMVKDTQNRFQHTSNKAIWGDGWGWAQFTDVKQPTVNTNQDKNYCQGCHLPRKETDWLYTDIYPQMQR